MTVALRIKLITVSVKHLAEFLAHNKGSINIILLLLLLLELNVFCSFGYSAIQLLFTKYLCHSAKNMQL